MVNKNEPDAKIFKKDVNLMVNKNEANDDKGMTTEDETEAAFDKYESYADICDGEVVEIYIGDEVHYGVLTFDRWKKRA